MDPTLKRKLATKRRNLAAQRQGLPVPGPDPAERMERTLALFQQRIARKRVRLAAKQQRARQLRAQQRKLRKHQEKLLKVAAQAGWGAQSIQDVKALVQAHNQGVSK